MFEKVKGLLRDDRNGSFITNEITVPAVALMGLCVMPGMVIHFDVSKKESVMSVEKAMTENQKVFLTTHKDGGKSAVTTENVFEIGTLAVVKQMIKLPNDVVRILVEGVERARLVKLEGGADGYLTARIVVCEKSDAELSAEANDIKCQAMKRELMPLLSEYAVHYPKVGKTFEKRAESIKSISVLLDEIAANIPVDYVKKQSILASLDVEERFRRVETILKDEIEIAKIRKEISSDVKSRIDKNQKEYVLREQMHAIKQELGEDKEEDEIESYRKQCEELNASDTVKEKINKEIGRLEGLSKTSSENAVARGYIETLLSLPWDKMMDENRDLANAEKILEQDHYGMKKVKERMLEFLAVRNLTTKGEAPIICLVGPPGTGKTSIARSIARALDKKYVRISLGGVRDEAEIRGHRRTYVGAMCGRIANGLIDAECKNPLMLLDEIDKVSSDYKGDTSSALLEVLDSEQNNKFRDHYVELPLDLSEVLFIATANNASDIPKPLLDRMEIVEVNSYTENEKFHIAKEHLIKKQLEKNGLKKNQFILTDEALRELIHSYTREAGVRGLERKIGQLCRKVAKLIYDGKEKSVTIKKKNLKDYLGKKIYTYDPANEKDEVGIVRGLAWTAVGGDTLSIECNMMPGKGEVSLTGQLGDVMKESALTGLSYIRSVAKDYGIDNEVFYKNDFHIHIPEGATPKDGPSAGITMATAMLSAITHIPVKALVAMTGEITLRGRVLPIGGLKEKLLAAKNAGIKKVLVPANNDKDIEEIEEEILDGLNIVFVENMEQVVKEAFKKKKKK